MTSFGLLCKSWKVVAGRQGVGTAVEPTKAWESRRVQGSREVSGYFAEGDCLLNASLLIPDLQEQFSCYFC